MHWVQSCDAFGLLMGNASNTLSFAQSTQANQFTGFTALCFMRLPKVSFALKRLLRAGQDVLWCVDSAVDIASNSPMQYCSVSKEQTCPLTWLLLKNARVAWHNSTRQSLCKHQYRLLAGRLVRSYAGIAWCTHTAISLLISMAYAHLIRPTMLCGSAGCRLGGVQHQAAAGVDAPHLWRLAQTLHLPLHLPN